MVPDDGSQRPDDGSQLPGIFGVYMQVSSLDRSLSFYRDVLALELDWSDGPMAVLHGSLNAADKLVLREVGEGPRRELGQPGVTRVLWRAADSAELDRAEEYLRSLEVPYQRHREETPDGLTVRDPDGVEFVLLPAGGDVSAGPPAWLHWYH
jgi:catechol 2,3-dioxygenase-like lactoylglutathione lyase family enzyme